MQAEGSRPASYGFEIAGCGIRNLIENGSNGELEGWKKGLEYWSDGLLEFWGKRRQKQMIGSFQHSSIPLFRYSGLLLLPILTTPTGRGLGS